MNRQAGGAGESIADPRYGRARAPRNVRGPGGSRAEVATGRTGPGPRAPVVCSCRYRGARNNMRGCISPGDRVVFGPEEISRPTNSRWI
ncbi:hypothetical protein J6590_051675 [Homalodisca vitripennis]|nr:hypothetical protein J6590_051675 [Homalodisca vitripennis]